MFTLVTDRSRYYRVKRGQTAAEIERSLNTPVNGAAFVGRIIEVRPEHLEIYSVGVGESYRLIALKFGINEDELRKLNGGKPVYPTCRIFVPCK